MPFEAAKAVAATFCWNMRHALTPIFGIDFLSICIHPESDRYGDMVIDPAITRRCVEEARHYRVLEARTGPKNPSTNRSPVTPDSPLFPHYVKQLRPKTVREYDSGSSYGTDTDNEARYYLSPRMPPHNTWTPANTPRSTPVQDFRLPSPQEILAGVSMTSMPAIRDHERSASSRSSSPVAPAKRRIQDVDEDYDASSLSESSSMGGDEAPKRQKRSESPGPDEKAAYLLMSLSLRKVASDEVERREKRRRASA